LDNRPVGIFDSGVGGLTVLKEIIKLVPDENIIYFGDTARFPYGPRDLNEVRKFVYKITDFLYKQNVKLLVIACNTSTAAALHELKNISPIPVIGVIEPGARAAAHVTKKNKVGVIATKGTVYSNAYEIEIKKINPEIKLFSVAAPLLVDYVEEGILSGEELRKTIYNYLKPLNNCEIDVLILGCTHFPLIENEIKACCKRGTKVINSAVETSRDVKRILEYSRICADPGRRLVDSNAIKNSTPSRIFYETGSASKFLEVGRIFLGPEIKEVKKIKLDI
jgi:glutamate racemase